MCLVDHPLEGFAPRKLKREVIRIHRMIRAVDQFDFEIDQRIARERPPGRGIFDALLDRGPPLLRYCAAEDLVFKLKPAAARERLEDTLAIAELTATTGLFLVAPLHFHAIFDRFTVRHFRLM